MAKSRSQQAFNELIFSTSSEYPTVYRGGSLTAAYHSLERSKYRRIDNIIFDGIQILIYKVKRIIRNTIHAEINHLSTCPSVQMEADDAKKRG